MARNQPKGSTRLRSELTLRQLGGGADEIAALRRTQALERAWLAAAKELRSLIRDKRVYNGDELKNFIESKNIELSKVNAQDGDYNKAIARITNEIEEKVAKTRAEFGTLGELPMMHPRQDAETLRRYYDDTNIQMGHIKGPGDTTSSVGRQVWFIGDQFRRGDTFTFRDANGDRVKVDSIGAGRPLKEVPNFEAGIDLGTPVYILPEEYYQRGKV